MGAYETDLLQAWEKNATKPSELMQDFRGLGTIMPNLSAPTSEAEGHRSSVATRKLSIPLLLF